MNDRYTSPALSRDLAAAGLEQRVIPGNEMTRYWWLHSKVLGVAGDFGAKYLEPGTCARALDLTDVLAEIEKRGATWLVETDHDTYCATAVLNPKFFAVMGGPSAVEAAGLCLLALLDKLREAKP